MCTRERERESKMLKEKWKGKKVLGDDKSKGLFLYTEKRTPMLNMQLLLFFSPLEHTLPPCHGSSSVYVSKYSRERKRERKRVSVCIAAEQAVIQVDW